MVQHRICDSEEQEKVIGILRKRMDGRRDMKRKLDIIRNQICGESQRLSPTSAFVNSRLEGKLRPYWPTARGSMMTERGFDRTRALQSMQELQHSPEKGREPLASGVAAIQKVSGTGSVTTPQNVTPKAGAVLQTPTLLPSLSATPEKGASAGPSKDLQKSPTLGRQQTTTKAPAPTQPPSAPRSRSIANPFGPMPGQPEYHAMRHVIHRANLNRKAKSKIQRQDIEEKPYLDPKRLNRETYEIMSTKKLRSLSVVQKMFDAVSQDRRVISLLRIEDDGMSTKATSALSSKWKLLRDPGENRQLNQYVRFLLGVQPAQPAKKGLGLHAKNLLAQVKKHQQKEKEALALEAGQKHDNFKEKFDQYVAKEQDVMKQVAANLEDKVHYIDLCKQGHTQGVQQRHANDPKFQYF